MSTPDQPRQPPWPARSRPIRVAGGLRARSTRGTIGEHWWSRRFLAVLEALAIGGRLARGRSYARAGQVLSLAVDPGEVTASVQGSRTTPYRVRIGLAPFPEPVWRRVEETLAGQALYGAQLLAGRMPPDIEQVFTAAGAPLFPERAGEVAMACTCPDPVVPCKHLAATFYLLAESFDTDPFRILHWRGREREPLLARLRELRAGGGGAGEPHRPVPPAAPVGATAVLAELAGVTLGDSLDRLSPDRFWLPPVPLPPRTPTLDTEPDLLLRQLPAPSPALGGAGLVEALRGAYRRFGVLPS